MNRSSYNAVALSWDAARTSFYGRERSYLDIFLEGLPVPSRILDIGCGTGRPIAEYILARGHHLTGVDQASKLLDLARSRFPEGTWIESRIEDFEATEQFAGVVCWDALFHIERSSHDALLSRVAKMVGIDGRLMLTVGGSDHPAFTDTMFGETFFYDSHPPEKVLSLLHQLGFEPLVSEFMNEPTSGRDKGRFAIVTQMT
ncbi:MAG: class I SAM-dependent methyltransferase [Burkholderiales bacterium]